jgi:hypothetical protein
MAEVPKAPGMPERSLAAWELIVESGRESPVRALASAVASLLVPDRK